MSKYSISALKYFVPNDTKKYQIHHRQPDGVLVYCNGTASGTPIQQNKRFMDADRIQCYLCGVLNSKWRSTCHKCGAEL